jgi:glucose/arabinose dehydrogenase
VRLSRSQRLGLFTVVLAIVAIVAVVVLRRPLQQATGVNADLGPGGRAELVVPDGYMSAVFAEGLATPRFMAVSPDGTLMLAERGADRILAFPDVDRDGGADRIVEVGRGYEGAHSLAFEADGSMLVAGETTLFRVSLGPDLRERSRAVVLDGLTTGGHSTRTVAVLPDGRILLSAGSTCNACIEPDPRRAAIIIVDPDDGSDRVYMSGLRNAVGVWVDPAARRAWATNMGRDMLGDDIPPETLYEVVDGADAGWPRCHAGSIPDPQFGVAGACDGVAQPALTFTAHSAPLALTGWEGHLVIAFHGSWNRSEKAGYEVVWLPWDGEPAGSPEPLATGFLKRDAVGALGRPAGLAVGADGALYVSDDKAGFIYRISRR